ncbi:Rapid ALkalinization Factor [Arabidopsis thaliana x Arabidopsis arenosa]|uniref:RALFL10 n=2 Tax=Arabidopsis TaxID=3701 RepID=A0A178VZM1_ARATH|nr:Rapid ALkalinization Factor [Arabidopsis thaliana x Arabidopsis arenosa]OAP11717.1 RALFL10 [Arabidopsis thaliana]
MKAWVICLLVIFAAVIAEPVESRRKYLDYGVITKCAGPNPPPGCYPPGAQQKNPTPANEYRRGCSKITRCKRD